MAVGALIGAYQEDDSGRLRALLPLSGRTLIEYQVRCASAAGAAPIVIVVERVPQALQDAFERLRLDGVAIISVSDVSEAVSRFEAGSLILLIGDGVVPSADLVARVAQEPEPAVATVPDDEDHAMFERIDSESRWGGVALVDAQLLGSTAAILGDWDLQSTLLRRTLQEGAVRLPVGESAGEPLLAESSDALDDFQRRLFISSRGVRPDWVSRFLLPPIEEFATGQLMESAVKPIWLMWAALALTLGGAFCFSRGWLGAGLVLLILSMPLDLISSRLATLRLKPLAVRTWSKMALWPAAGIALLTLGWWEMRHVSGWGALVCALGAIAFAEAARIERTSMQDGELWLVSRRSAIVLAIPFALAGAWTSYLILLVAYAMITFFIVQHVRHQPSELTRS
ncbi:MAG TPA: NTP transferase domain-containing protein [Sphingomicrobium sp.]|jgi:hypothetical protein